MVGRPRRGQRRFTILEVAAVWAMYGTADVARVNRQLNTRLNTRCSNKHTPARISCYRLSFTTNFPSR